MPHRAGRLAVLLVAAGLVAACGTQATTPRETPPLPPPLPVALDVPTDTAALVAADDQFGLDLLTSPANPQDGNLVLSPASVATALQMVATGARGRTLIELTEVLHTTVLKSLPPDPGTTVSNTVWTQRGLPIEKPFTDTLGTSFAARIHTADFQHDPDTAIKQINSTVAGQTKGLIPTLFPAGSLDYSTQLVLTNAIYLKADWAHAFPAKQTAPESFTRADGSVVQVPMMHSDTEDGPSPYGYATGPGYQVVTLPYASGNLAFTLLLPTGNSLKDLTDLLHTKGLPAILKDVKQTPIALAMPRFTITTNLDLSATLASLGMPSAFSDDADFSGITKAAPLSLQTVQHDAVVKVDEHGTVAAAATGVGVQATAGRVVPQVNADHPFLFVITDTATGAPLFLGRVTDPAH